MLSLTTTEVLLLLLMAGSADSTDLASLIHPAHYFKSRQIEPTLDRMIDFAIADPSTAKVQIRQLTALRHLVDEADKFKKAKNYESNREAIEEIAQGKRGSDPQGFAAEYAKRFLASLDGAKRPVVKAPPFRDEALAWFPANVRFAWAINLRETNGVTDDPLKDLAKRLSDKIKTQLYDNLERTGNVRIDRVAFGIVDAPKNQDQKIFLRLTGKGNPAWMADVLGTSGRVAVTKKMKADDGTPVLLLTGNARGSAMFVGDTDIVLMGIYNFQGNLENLAAEVLDIRAKKKPNAHGGALKDRLSKVPDKAVAFAVTDLSDEFRKSLAYLLDPFPAKVSAYIERTPQGLDVKAETTAADAKEANNLVKKIGEMRKEFIKDIQDARKNPDPDGPVPPYQAVINLLESVQVQTKAEKADIRGLVPGGTLQQLLDAAMYFEPPRGFTSPGQYRNFKDFNR